MKTSQLPLTMMVRPFARENVAAVIPVMFEPSQVINTTTAGVRWYAGVE